MFAAEYTVYNLETAEIIRFVPLKDTALRLESRAWHKERQTSNTGARIWDLLEYIANNAWGLEGCPSLNRESSALVPFHKGEDIIPMVHKTACGTQQFYVMHLNRATHEAIIRPIG